MRINSGAIPDPVSHLPSFRWRHCRFGRNPKIQSAGVRNSHFVPGPTRFRWWRPMPPLSGPHACRDVGPTMHLPTCQLVSFPPAPPCRGRIRSSLTDPSSPDLGEEHSWYAHTPLCGAACGGGPGWEGRLTPHNAVSLSLSLETHPEGEDVSPRLPSAPSGCDAAVCFGPAASRAWPETAALQGAINRY